MCQLNSTKTTNNVPNQSTAAHTSHHALGLLTDISSNFKQKLFPSIHCVRWAGSFLRRGTHVKVAAGETFPHHIFVYPGTLLQLLDDISSSDTVWDVDSHAHPCEQRGLYSNDVVIRLGGRVEEWHKSNHKAGTYKYNCSCCSCRNWEHMEAAKLEREDMTTTNSNMAVGCDA